jgi:hypothetical protein
MLAVELTLAALDRANDALGIDASWLEMFGEQNLTTWFSSMQFAAASSAAGVAVWLGSGRATVWLTLAAVMALFSIDEIVMLHERVEVGTNPGTVVQIIEPLGAVAALLVGLYIARRVSRRQRVLLLLAATALVLANVLAAINDASAFSSFEATTLSAGEELGEMLVGTFVLAAALPLAVGRLRLE